MNVKLQEIQAVMDDDRRSGEDLTVIRVTFRLNDWQSKT
jgi:hypothetical protein